MKVGSIDLGTNTCLLLIAESKGLGAPVDRTLLDLATVVRLGQGVDQSRLLNPTAMDRTIECLRQYAKRVIEFGLEPASVVAVATSQARDAKNGADFFASIEQETGFRFRVLSGEQEAQATFVGGLLPGMDSARCAVIDIGGGSTELMGTTGGRSIDVGSVRFTERYLKTDPVTDVEFWACREAIDRELKAFRSIRDAMPASTELVAVAGTATTLAAAHLGLSPFDAARVDGTRLKRGDLHRLVEELKWRTVTLRLKMPGVEVGRADVLLAGALILWRTCEELGFREVVVSTRGLRYGMLQLKA